MQQEHVDAAALLGTALAVVLAVLVPEGPFDYMNFAVGITVLAIIGAYQWGRARPLRIQSIAMSCTVALVATLNVGVIAEICVSGFRLDGHIECMYLTSASGMYKCWRDTNVPPWVVPTSWALMTVALYAVDRYIQRRRLAATPQIQTKVAGKADGDRNAAHEAAGTVAAPLLPGESKIEADRSKQSPNA
jgi:hypothetical protein